MKIACIQHVSFEGPAYFKDWAEKNGHTLKVTHIYNEEPLPYLEDFDMLLIMGGPMSVHDAEQFPWMKDELDLIKRSSLEGKKTLGICLGGQLISLALGGQVLPGLQKEIGWFPVDERREIPESWKGVIPKKQEVFHWHSERFRPPMGSVPLWKSMLCPDQAFHYKNNTLALQFHLETTVESATDLIDNCLHELTGEPSTQSKEEMLKDTERFTELNKTLDQLMEIWLD